MEALIETIPLIIAALVPPALTWFRENVAMLVPDHLIPVLLPVAGGLVAGLAKLAGFDIGDFNADTADFSTWATVIAGALTGLAVNGAHQVGKQWKERPTDDDLDDEAGI